MISELVIDWDQYLNFYKDSDKDIYFSQKYVSLYEADNEKAVCFIANSANNYMVFPFLRREFYFEGKIVYDFETAYGYGGPIFNTNDSFFKKEALQAMIDYFENNNYVAGFIRFHPLLLNAESCKEIGKIELIHDRKTIAIDLTLSENDIWMKEIHSKNRNVIKKAINNGLIFIVDDKFKYLDEFIEIYNSTMSKLSADDFYYFNHRYYQNIKERFHNSFLGVVKKDNLVIAAAIFFCEGIYGHYHLSGSRKDFLNLLPNNFMLYEAALELKKRGAEYFHLGGGTTSSPEDTLFCFKNKFSKKEYQFSIGKMIFNESIYNQLCECWELNNYTKIEHYKHFLLKYKY